MFHENKIEESEECLRSLNLNHKKLYTEITDRKSFDQDHKTNQKKVLWSVLIINLVFFILEMSYGLVSKSMGLIAEAWICSQIVLFTQSA